jgi:hypothetical protein
MVTRSLGSLYGHWGAIAPRVQNKCVHPEQFFVSCGQFQDSRGTDVELMGDFY